MDKGPNGNNKNGLTDGNKDATKDQPDPESEEVEVESSHSNELNNTQYLTDSDEDYADYSYRNTSPLELLDKKDTQNTDRIPLIPTDYSSILEAMQNFRAVFESRYGAQHAPIYDGSLQNAITEAFDCPNIEERRPLALYLHHDDAVASHIFPQTILCSSEISSLLKCQFIVWAWDITQYENRQNFYEWMSIGNLGTVNESIRQIPHNKYPLLVIIVKERGQIQRSSLIYGQDNLASAMQKLMIGLDQYQIIKDQDKQEERFRNEREQFRREQAEEYEQSLAADRAKQQEINRQKEQQKKEEQLKLKEEENKKQHLSALAQILPSEPDEADPNCVIIRFRCPNGEQKTRRFRNEESLEMLIIFSETIGFDRVRYRLWTSDRPKKEISNMDSSKSFAELNWPKREQITVEEV